MTANTINTVPADTMPDAAAIAATVTDPELPMLTLADLGVLREVSERDGVVTVSITPTYTGCPGMDAMRAELERALMHAGYREVHTRIVLQPAWSTDWISERGRRNLAEAGIAPPGPATHHVSGPIPLTLTAPPSRTRCPRCGSSDTELVSRYGATACKSLRRCRACREPFEQFKEI